MTMMHFHTIGPDIDGDLLEELEGRELSRPPVYHDADDPRVTALRAYWQAQPRPENTTRRTGDQIVENLIRAKADMLAVNNTRRQAAEDRARAAHRAYIVTNQTIAEIAREFGTTADSLSKYWRRLGLPKRDEDAVMLRVAALIREARAAGATHIEVDGHKVEL